MAEAEIERLNLLLAEKDAKIDKLEKTAVPRKVKRKTKAQLELERIEKLPERRVGLPSDISTKKLQKHQLEFTKNFIDGDLRGAMAIHGVGSGKTLTAVVSGEMFLNKFPNSKVFVITPASLLAGFKEELYTYDPAIEKDKRYKFFTYDGYSNGVKRGDTDTNCKDALLIVDEGQNLRTTIKKNEVAIYDPDSQVWTVRETIKSGAKVLNILKGCALKAKKVLILSATPLVNHPNDIENLMAMINGHEPLDPKSYAFEKIWSNPKIAHRYFGCRLSFFENSPVVRDEFFPKMEERFVPLVMNSKTLEDYMKIEREKPTASLVKELKINPEASKINSFYTAVRKASNALGGDNSQKVNFIISFIKSVLAKKPNSKVGLTKKIIDTHTDKTIIFTHFLDAGSKLIIERLKQENIPFGAINGGVSKNKRAEIVRAYVAGDIKVILISKAGAEGLNLLETGYIFMVEPSWNNAEREQVKGRGVRFMSHANLPENKRNVLILSLFLIKPKEKKEFKKLLRGDTDAISRTGYVANNLPSVDLYLFSRSNAQQDFLDGVLNDLRKTDPLEDCKQPKEFLDITNLFSVKRTTEIPSLTKWEKDFYSKTIKNDKPELPEREADDFSMTQLKNEMTSLTRQVFGGDKALVQLQNAFFTPPRIAQDMVEFSGIGSADSDIVFLEPSAGAGFIVFEALQANKKVYCNAVENLQSLQAFLEEFPRTDVLPQRNFFDVSPFKKYRVILMNPPYSLKKDMGLSRVTHDVDFVMKAFSHLEEEGILVALISNKFEFRGLDKKGKTDKKIFDAFRKLLDDNEHKIIKYEDGFSKKGGAVMEEMETAVQLRMIKILKKKK